jgi:nitroreductase
VAWRGAPQPAPAPPPSGAATPLPAVDLDAAVPEPIETVILRRGSTRRFARTPIDVTRVAAILSSATRGIPTDPGPAAPIADLYLIVNAVDGLSPGSYVFDRTARALTLLRAGDFRRDAGHLGLGQELPADAALDVFWLIGLPPVLDRFGNRGYRAAQLAAAIEAGKTYLAAYALGLGATGLTFFDDDVTRFFSPHAAGKSVMFLMAFGQPSSATRG